MIRSAQFSSRTTLGIGDQPNTRFRIAPVTQILAGNISVFCAGFAIVGNRGQCIGCDNGRRGNTANSADSAKHRYGALDGSLLRDCELPPALWLQTRLDGAGRRRGLEMKGSAGGGCRCREGYEDFSSIPGSIIMMAWRLDARERRITIK